MQIIIDELRFFCTDEVLDSLTGESGIQMTQLKDEFSDEVIDVDTKGLKCFFSEEAWMEVTEKGAVT